MPDITLTTDPWMGRGREPRIEVAYWTHDRVAVEARLRQWAADLHEAQATITAAEARIAATVHELRTAGASWAVVGRLLGVTKAAAHKRYGQTDATLPGAS